MRFPWSFLRRLVMFSSCMGGVVAGAQQFKQLTVVGTGNWPTLVETADLNGDGLPDLIYTDYGGTAGASKSHVLLNSGGGVFRPGQPLDTAGTSIAVADMDGDGHPDLVWVSSSATTGTVSFARGLGDGTFATATTSSFPLQAGVTPSLTYVAAGKFTGGRTPDVLVEDSANSVVYVLRNAGNGSSFASAFVGKLPDGAGPVFTADLNGDGLDDFVIQGKSGNAATVYLAGSSGTVFTGTRYTGSGVVKSMLLHDMNGDGHQDLVLEGAAGRIDIYIGIRDGSFETVTSGGTGPLLDGATGNGGQLVAIADVAGGTRRNIYAATPAGISALIGQGNLTYVLKDIYNAGPGRTSFAFADFNGDGIPDIAVDSPEGIAMLYGNGDGSLQSDLAFATGKPALYSALGKFTQSGNLDVAVSTAATQGQLMLGDGKGRFAARPTPTTAQTGNPALWSTVLPGDFNGDGNLDLAFTQTGLPLPTTGSGLSVQYGDGTGNFTDPVAVPSLGLRNYFGTSAVGDLNGDGIDDIANLNGYSYETLLGQPGQKTGLFTKGLSFPEDGVAPSGDLDSFSIVAAGFFKVGRKNKQDLVFQDDANITPYVNSGDGAHFTTPVGSGLTGVPAVQSLYGGQITIGDIDGDGNADIIIPYYNVAGATPANPTTAFPNVLYIWYGKGNGTFGPPQKTTLSRNYYLGALVDMNGDGLPDLVLSDGFLVSILYNQGNKTFGDEHHFLAGQGINSLSLVDVNGDGMLDLVVANGGAAISYPVALGGLKLGTRSISLPVNPDVNTGAITVLLNNFKATAVTGTLTAVPEPSVVGSPFTMTATLVPPTGSMAAITGSVAVSVDGVATGTAPVSSNVVTVTGPKTLSAGTHTITAVYSGDANYGPRTINTTHDVALIATNTVLTITSSLTIYFGQGITGTASASAVDGSTLTGTISFLDGTTLICTLPVTPGSTCSPSAGAQFGVGMHPLTAVYSGDATHAGSTSNVIVITVLQDVTTATLVSSLNPADFGTPVTLTATVTGNADPATGVVNFLDGGSLIGTATLDAQGKASLTTSTLAVGSHPITAVYAATANFQAATSTVLVQVIKPVVLAATSTQLSSSLNPSTVGQSVTFTASVTTPGVVTKVPTGLVTFLDGSATLGMATLDGLGAARFSTSALAPGSHNITATYPGDSATSGSISAVLVQVVNDVVVPGGFTLTVTPVPISIATGGVVNLLVTVGGTGGLIPSVGLGCAGLPYESACTFGVQTIPAGGGTTTLQLTAMAPHDCDNPGASYASNGWGAAGPALAGLVLLCLPGRRRWMRGLLAVAAVAGLATLGGCGHCTDLGTRPGVYTFRVVATAAAPGSGTAAASPGVVTVPVKMTVFVP